MVAKYPNFAIIRNSNVNCIATFNIFDLSRKIFSVIFFPHSQRYSLSRQLFVINLRFLLKSGATPTATFQCAMLVQCGTIRTLCQWYNQLSPEKKIGGNVACIIPCKNSIYNSNFLLVQKL